MFGLSLSKLLFTLLVIVAVWRGFRLLREIQERREAAGRRGRPSRRERVRRGEALELEPCPGCGTYLPRGTACPSCTASGARPPKAGG